MNENQQDPAAPSQEPTTSGEAPSSATPESAPQAASPESTDAGASGAPSGEGGAAPGESRGDAGPQEAGKGEGPRRRNRKGKGGRGGPGGGAGPSGDRSHGGHAPHPGHSSHRFVEDRIDADAEHLARDARYIPASRVRPLAQMTGTVRRLLASPDAHDQREARRVLVLFRARIAFLAGRESGRERSAFVRVRDFVLRGIDMVTRDREYLDPLQVRNFLDQVDAFVGYHRFHCDDRRRD